MHQAGFDNAVATLGTAITPDHARTVARYCRTVYLAYDIDKAGRKATMKAIELLNQVGVDTKIINLGTGNGYSVLQIVKAFEKASGRKVPYVIKPRRPGDVAECWADPSFAKEELGWKAERGIEKMCEDLWRWQSMNPYGFKSKE